MLRLKELRKEKGLTQQELADKCLLGRRTISDYERGISMPGAYELNQLSKFFNVSIDYLLGNTDERPLASPADRVDIAFFNQHGIVSDDQKKEIESFIKFVKAKNEK